jgi:integrase
MAQRRRNDEGSLTLRKDGLWGARVFHEGQRIAVYGKTKEEARQKLHALQRKQDQGLLLVTFQMLLKDYLVQWLENIQHRVRPKTLADYKDLVRCHLIPRLGQVRLKKLEPEHIQKAWNDMLKERRSYSLVEHCHLCLSTALNDAMRRQFIYRNPCQMVSPPRAVKKEVNPPDVNTTNRLLETARGTEYFEVLHTAFYTGMRRGELLAVRWRDVNLDMGTLSVNRSVYRAKGAQFIYQEPKTAKGRRLVDLPPESVLVLRRLRERQEADGQLQGYIVNEDTLVFSYRDGSLILPRGLTGAFVRLMRRAGLEGYRLHDARHTHAPAGRKPQGNPGKAGPRQGNYHPRHLLPSHTRTSAGGCCPIQRSLESSQGTDTSIRRIGTVIGTNLAKSKAPGPSPGAFCA